MKKYRIISIKTNGVHNWYIVQKRKWLFFWDNIAKSDHPLGALEFAFNNNYYPCKIDI